MVGGSCVLVQVGIVFNYREGERFWVQVDLLWLSEGVCREAHRVNKQQLAPEEERKADSGLCVVLT